MNFSNHVVEDLDCLKSFAERKLEDTVPSDPEEIVDVYWWRYEGSQFNNPWRRIDSANKLLKHMLDNSLESIQEDIEITLNKRLHFLLIPEGIQVPRERKREINIKELHSYDGRDNEAFIPEIEDVI